MKRNVLIRLFGFRAILFQGDVLFLERVHWIKKRLRPGNLRTLDAGCGVGGLTMLSAKMGNNATGLTFSDVDASVAKERASICGAGNATFEVVDLRELEKHVSRLGQYDQIIACEVIEHILDDEKLFLNFSKLLRKDGFLYLTTPSLNHYPVCGETFSSVENGGHVRFGYTHERLQELCEKNAIEAIELGYINGFFAQKVFSLYVRLCSIHAKFAWLATLPLRPLRHLDGIVNSISGFPKMSTTLIGRKK